MQPTTQATPVGMAGYPGTVIRMAPGQTMQAMPQQTVVVRPGMTSMPQAVGGAPVIRTVMPGSTTMPAQYVQAPGQPQPRVVYASAPGGGAHGQPLTGSVRYMAAPGGQPQQMYAAAPRVVTTTTRPHTLAGPGYTQGAYEVKHQDDPQLQNLKELRKTSGLKNVPVGDGLALLKNAAVDGKLTRELFLESYEELLHKNNIESPEESVRNAVFDLFDRDDNNVVDMMELICGISLLCSGTEDDKIHAVFEVFDENGDGFISMDEMFKFLTSVFKVVLTPNVMGVMNSMGVTVESAEDLASVTSLECFKTADLNHDGKLSVTEFKNWFYAPRNDPSFLFSPVRKLLQ
mmetsp:Transcript_46625/g.123129  ORF Transcript_46625/g.123129 Transcript_46625/m.123129 type:complete len:346 (-) Transcript_46625:129-1166(-)